MRFKDKMNNINKMSRNFSKGKIYKITNDFNDDVYVGSTCDELNKRMNIHKYKANGNERSHLPIYKLMNEIGFNRFRIDLIEDCPCNNIYDLRKKEGYWIK